MQSCYECGQEVDLKRSQSGIWQRLNPGGSAHRCLEQKKLRCATEEKGTVENKNPRWGEGKTLIGLWKHPDPGSLIIPEDFQAENPTPEETGEEKGGR